jgi:hypothetical protein
MVEELNQLRQGQAIKTIKGFVLPGGSPDYPIRTLLQFE